MLDPNEAPDFVHLNALARQMAKDAILIRGASAPCIDQQLSDRVLAGAGQARDGADGTALTRAYEGYGRDLLGTAGSCPGMYIPMLERSSMLIDS
jgi:hypothetical protein